MASVIQLYIDRKKALPKALRQLADQLEQEDQDVKSFFILLMTEAHDRKQYSYTQYNFDTADLMLGLEVSKCCLIEDYSAREE